jgi:hypothetical protein
MVTLAFQKYVTSDGRKAVPKHQDDDKDHKLMGYERANGVIRVIDGRCLSDGELPGHIALEGAWWLIAEGLAIAKGSDIDLPSAMAYVRDRSQTSALLEAQEIALDQIKKVCDIVDRKPTKYKLTRGELAGQYINLTAAERTKYRAFTMIAIDQPRSELKALRKIAQRSLNRHSMKIKRMNEGATPRERSLSRTKPWEKLGISRATWYSQGKPSAEPTAEIIQLHPDKIG